MPGCGMHSRPKLTEKASYKQGWFLGGSGGRSPPNFFINLAFHNALNLLPIFCTILLWWVSSLLYGYWDLCRCWLCYITTRLNYHVSIFKHMGVSENAPHPFFTLYLEPAMLKFLEITPGYKALFKRSKISPNINAGQMLDLTAYSK